MRFKLGTGLPQVSNLFNRWVHPYYPTYYFPEEDLPHIYLEEATSTPQLAIYNLLAANKPTHALTRHYETELAGLFTIKFSVMDAWFEEDEEIFVHPKDPYKMNL